MNDATHRRRRTLGSLLGLGALLLPALAWAQGVGGGMPWETPIQHIVTSITGPVAKAIGVVSIFIFGATMAFSDGGGLRVVMGIIFGLSIMFAAAQWGLTFFGFAGGGGL